MRYVGITFGPIVEALDLARTPAGLWAASFLFSQLSRDVCAGLALQVGEEAIILPYFSAGDPGLSLEDGVGLFHDRIIARSEDLSLEQVNAVIREAKDNLAWKLLRNALGAAKAGPAAPPGAAGAQTPEADAYLAYFRAFFRVRAIAFNTDGNPVLVGGPKLDAIELEPQFSQQEARNHLLELFESDPTSRRNDRIKSLVHSTFNVGQDWQLLGNAKIDGKPQAASIRDLADIARSGLAQLEAAGPNPAQPNRAQPGAAALDRLKRYRYYCVLQCDGDNVGRLLAATATGDIRAEFSKKLQGYSRRAAEIIYEYGGVTLYAGGDDLLAIVPVAGTCERTILDLAADLAAEFAKATAATAPEGPPGGNAPHPPPDAAPPAGATLSLGAAICYYKYPLYEALARARGLLFGQAKNAPGKGALAVSLVKHSGQTADFTLPQFTQTEVAAKLGDVIRWSDGVYCNSVAHHLRQFDALFSRAEKSDELKALFDNTFDADFHAQIEGQLDVVRELSWLARTEAIQPGGLPPIDSLLRFARFFAEVGDDD
ncbi:MAG: hypothetical protein LBD51_03150 [Bifidobacteriaceae bacterium]|jgi:CRISPR-associated protein Cmr2|nr:hypothetical protein [Bifidobacteriaceae bacterium]